MMIGGLEAIKVGFKILEKTISSLPFSRLEIGKFELPTDIVAWITELLDLTF